MSFAGTFRFHCPSCNASIANAERLAGKVMACPLCGKRVLVPTEPEPEITVVPERDPTAAKPSKTPPPPTRPLREEPRPPQRGEPESASGFGPAAWFAVGACIFVGMIAAGMAAAIAMRPRDEAVAVPAPPPPKQTAPTPPLPPPKQPQPAKVAAAAPTAETELVSFQKAAGAFLDEAAVAARALEEQQKIADIKRQQDRASDSYLRIPAAPASLENLATSLKQVNTTLAAEVVLFDLANDLALRYGDYRSFPRSKEGAGILRQGIAEVRRRLDAADKSPWTFNEFAEPLQKTANERAKKAPSPP